MQLLLVLFGLIVEFVNLVRSGASAETIIVAEVTDILGALTPAQKLAATQFVESTAEEGIKAALRWLITKGHGPTTTDEARELQGAILAASGEAGPAN